MTSLIQTASNLHSVVADPVWQSALVLSVASAINEVIAVFPLAIVIASQVLLLEEPVTLTLVYKLIFLVALPVGVGSMIGTLPLYALSYFGGRPAINRFERVLRFSWQDVERHNERFKGEWYDELLFFFIRSIPILPSLPLTLVAGVMRLPLLKYALLTALGLTFRMILYLATFGLGFRSLSNLVTLIYNI